MKVALAMTPSWLRAASPLMASAYAFSSVRHGVPLPGRWLQATVTALLYGLRLWAAVCLALFLAFWLELDNAFWAGVTAAAVCQPALGASLRKGWFRLLGTLVGATMAVVLSACFLQDRLTLLLSLAMWVAICAASATLLRNFASYGAALAGYTTAIIIGDELGAVGGLNGDAFNLAVARGSEIGLGIVCASVVLAITCTAGARSRLATSLAGLSADIAGGLIRALRLAGPVEAESRPLRRLMIGRVARLDPMIDEAAGEITGLTFNPRIFRAAADSLFVALAAWRSIANHLEIAQDSGHEAARVWSCMPPELASPEAVGLPVSWQHEPSAMRGATWAAVRRLMALPAETPSMRLLCDRTAAGLLALRRVMDGVVSLNDPLQGHTPRGPVRLCIPDILPALINGSRAFLVVVGAALIWIRTAWPSGASFIVFATVGITLFAPREDTAYASAKTFTIGTAFAVVCAAVVSFAVLPQQVTFASLCATLGLVLVPAGAMSSQSWKQILFVALGVIFVALVRPSNPQAYDTVQFYNSATALLGGIGFAMLAFLLLPPMPPSMRVRRILALTLRDLRRLTHGRLLRSSEDWERRIHARLCAIPDSIDTVQAARMVAALSVGTELIRLRRVAHRFSLNADLEPAMDAIAVGRCSAAILALDRFDQALAALPEARPGARLRLSARGTIRSLANSLARHASYFGADARA
jgi:uncharacterized membrane protein YccC